MQKILSGLIRIYQRAFSPDQGFLVRHGLKKPGNHCVFYPTCSEYALLAIQKYGVLLGGGKAIKRIFRCHPWQTPQVDLP